MKEFNLDEQLAPFNPHDPNLKPEAYANYNKLLKQLLADFIEAVRPEHIDNWKDVDGTKLGERTASYSSKSLYRAAFNQALTQLDANVREVLK
jgi:hypothetical protein